MLFHSPVQVAYIKVIFFLGLLVTFYNGFSPGGPALTTLCVFSLLVEAF